MEQVEQLKDGNLNDYRVNPEQPYSYSPYPYNIRFIESSYKNQMEKVLMEMFQFYDEYQRNNDEYYYALQMAYLTLERVIYDFGASKINPQFYEIFAKIYFFMVNGLLYIDLNLKSLINLEENNVQDITTIRKLINVILKYSEGRIINEFPNTFIPTFTPNELKYDENKQKEIFETTFRNINSPESYEIIYNSSRYVKFNLFFIEFLRNY